MKKQKWTADQVRQWYQRNNPIFYFNKEDGNIVVRKAKSDGWTVNWANPMAYVIQGAILLAVLLMIALLRVLG